MDYRILFTEQALSDLSEFLDRIAQDDASGATRFGTALLDHIDLLSRFPLMGNLVSARSGVRRLIHSPMIIYYRVLGDTNAVEILHVRHGSRKPPAI